MQKDYGAIKLLIFQNVGIFSIVACKVISPNLPYDEQFDSATRIISMTVFRLNTYSYG